MEPITRVEQFLAKAAGMTSDCPEPITRVEMFLQKIAENGGGGGGNANIDVTAQVGQTIIVKEVDENGKPTEWEAVDYQPRTHWSEEGVLCEGTHEPSDSGEFVLDSTPDLTVGKTYKIVWNGVEYSCVAVDTTDTLGGVALGNVDALLGSGDTGEPFVIAVVEGVCAGAPLDGSTSVTLSIIGEKIIPIPVEYLTNVNPYYVRVVDGLATFETPDNLLAQYNLGREIYAKIGSADAQMIIPLTLVSADTGDAVFSARLAAKHSSGNYVFSDYLVTLTATDDGQYSVTFLVV